MLADVVDRLRCPHCAAALVLDGPVLRCTEGHAYDVARHGYVTLLPAPGPRHPGDTAEMVAAREAFLAAGHYVPIAEAVAEAARSAAAAAPRWAAPAAAGKSAGGEPAASIGVEAAGGQGVAGAAGVEAAGGGVAGAAGVEAVGSGGVAGSAGVAGADADVAGDDALTPGGDGAAGCVVDVGAGTGWYLARVLEGLPGWVGIAVDASRQALRQAAKLPRVGAVVADAWRPLPVRDAAANVALSVFAPRDAEEIGRILAPGGALIVVTPTPRHQVELVGELGMLSVDAEKPERLAVKLARFERVSRRELEFAMELGAEDVRTLVAMGPSAHHVDVAQLAVKAARVTAAVTVQTFRFAA